MDNNEINSIILKIYDEQKKTNKQIGKMQDQMKSMQDKIGGLEDKIGGLEVGSDVRISGIKVGSVLSTVLNKDDYTADVYMSIDPTVQLPDDTVAAIADVGIMGDKYIRLEPGKSGKLLKENDRILQTKNYKSLEDNVSEFIFLSTK